MTSTSGNFAILIVCVILIRYQNDYMIQLAIIPGPHNPKDLDSIIKPIVQEFQDIGSDGIVVKRNGIEVCRAKVNLVIATGDMPAAASLAHHSGHTTICGGCRFCRIDTQRLNSRNCFLDTNAPMRDKSDFVEGDTHFVSDK